MPAIPLLAHSRPDAVIAYRRGAAVRVAQFLGDVAQTAARLPAGGDVMNLCADRYRFAVGLAAALVRGGVSLLPPSTAPEVLRRIACDHPGACTLTDPDAEHPGAPPGIAVDVDAAPHAGAVAEVDACQTAVVC